MKKSESRLLVYLASLVFDNKQLHHKVLDFEGSPLQCLAIVDETKSWRDGLQAAAYRKDKEEVIYIVIRGADVGVGKTFFRKTGANERFIPRADEDTSWKTTFQDWIYISILGSMGLVELKQYSTLVTFYRQLRSKYPNSSIVVSGVSLGGLLAQRLYLLEGDVSRCITFSALSPWWTFYRGTQDFIKQQDFYRKDPNLINYYSNHDIFRWVPPLNRQLGQQYNVLLQPFQSRSNLIATLIERVYWAHIPNYYSYSSNGNIRIKEKVTRFEGLYRWLNQPFGKSKLVNSCVLLCLIVFSIIISFSLLLFGGLPYIDWIFNVPILSEHPKLLGGSVFLLFEILFALPSLLARSNWKLLIFFINMISLINIWLWPLLLSLAICSNRSANLPKVNQEV